MAQEDAHVTQVGGYVMMMAADGGGRMEGQRSVVHKITSINLLRGHVFRAHSACTGVQAGASDRMNGQISWKVPPLPRPERMRGRGTDMRRDQ